MSKTHRGAVALLYVSLLTLGVACSKSGGGSGTRSGRILGTIQTFDDKLNALTDMAGFTVSFQGAAGVSRTATADATGRYVIDDLPYDTYTLTFSKTGYGTFKLFGVVHQAVTGTSFTQVPNQSLGKTSTTTITAFSVAGNTINGGPGVQFNYNVSPVPSTASRAFVRYFLGNSAAVSPANFQAHSIVYNFSNLSNITGFSKDSLSAMGFSAGQTVFARLYGESFRANDYVDPATGKRVFPNINPTAAAAVSFVVP